jgi:hypothetical protein
MIVLDCEEICHVLYPLLVHVVSEVGQVQGLLTPDLAILKAPLLLTAATARSSPICLQLDSGCRKAVVHT